MIDTSIQIQRTEVDNFAKEIVNSSTNPSKHISGFHSINCLYLGASKHISGFHSINCLYLGARVGELGIRLSGSMN